MNERMVLKKIGKKISVLYIRTLKSKDLSIINITIIVMVLTPLT
jgi:hypothetical protein